jgi:hypothetical protein
VKAQILKTVAIVTRDLILTVVALGGIVHQELYGPVKPELLLLYASVLSLPTVFNVLALRSSSRTTDSPQRGPAEVSSPAPSPSSPSSS